MAVSEIKVHYYQKALLKKLIVTPGLRFNDLLIPGLLSEHMNYHLKQLLDAGLIEKQGDHYQLTDLGKDYGNLLDDNSEFVERQPKTSVIIWAVRRNSKTGKVEHLVNKRLRQPYYGKVGRLTGKVRFGETLQQAVARELFEETGLQADHFQLEKVYHKLRTREDGTTVQDILFYIFFISGLHGTLITKTEFQENFWISEADMHNRKDLDFYDDFEIDSRIRPAAELRFVESKEIAKGY